jgi:plastocyanin
MTRMKIAALAFAAAAGASALLLPKAVTGQTATATSSKNHPVSIGGTCGSFCYSPASLKIRQADTVTWTNNAGFGHTVTRCPTGATCSGVGPGSGTDPAFDSGTIIAGATFVLQFHGTGTYNYYCTIHGYGIMHGTITVLPFIVSTSTLPSGTVATAYSARLRTAGGESPFHWSRTSGALPPGLVLHPGGLISGTPTTTGTFQFTVQVTDSSSPALTARRALSIQIA